MIHAQFDQLIVLLKSRDADVRHKALSRLGDVADTRAIPYLIFVAGHDEDSKIREFAVLLLADYHDPSIADFYFSKVNDPRLSLGEMQQIAQQLSHYDQEQSINALLSLSGRDDHYVLQQFIAESLYVLNRPRLHKYWLDLASASIDPFVQNIADRALEQLRYSA